MDQRVGCKGEQRLLTQKAFELLSTHMVKAKLYDTNDVEIPGIGMCMQEACVTWESKDTFIYTELQFYIPKGFCAAYVALFDLFDPDPVCVLTLENRIKGEGAYKSFEINLGFSST